MGLVPSGFGSALSVMTSMWRTSFESPYLRQKISLVMGTCSCMYSSASRSLFASFLVSVSTTSEATNTSMMVRTPEFPPAAEERRMSERGCDCPKSMISDCCGIY